MAKVPQSVQYIKEALDKEDIERVWDYLGKTFGFNLRKWKEEFNASIKPLPRDTSVEEAFIIFGKQRIEPLLNEILRRKQRPTWIALLTFLLRDKISARQKRNEKYKERFK